MVLNIFAQLWILDKLSIAILSSLRKFIPGVESDLHKINLMYIVKIFVLL